MRKPPSRHDTFAKMIHSAFVIIEITSVSHVPRIMLVVDGAEVFNLPDVSNYDEEANTLPANGKHHSALLSEMAFVFLSQIH